MLFVLDYLLSQEKEDYNNKNNKKSNTVECQGKQQKKQEKQNIQQKEGKWDPILMLFFVVKIESRVGVTTSCKHVRITILGLISRRGQGFSLYFPIVLLYC